MKRLKAEYLSLVNERLAYLHVHYHKKDLKLGMIEEDPSDNHLDTGVDIKNSLVNVCFKLFPIERMPFFKINDMPVFFETEYLGKKKQKRSDDQPNGPYHVFILLHGLDAVHANMVLMMKQISMVCDNAEFILPKSKLVKT